MKITTILASATAVGLGYFAFGGEGNSYCTKDANDRLIVTDDKGLNFRRADEYVITDAGDRCRIRASGEPILIPYKAPVIQPKTPS